MLKILLIHLHQSFTKAVDFAHEFIRSQDSFEENKKEKQSCLDNIGLVSPFWQIMSFLSIPIVFTLSFYESQNASLILTNIFDPYGRYGILFSWFTSMIGFVLALVVIFFSHLLSELAEKKLDHLSGKYVRQLDWWFYTILCGLLIYVVLHLLITFFDFRGSLLVGFVALCIASLEVLFGLFIFGKALTYIKLFFVNIKLKRNERRMSYYAKKTHTAYTYYLFLLEKYNYENPHNMKKPQWRNSIARAVAFFGGEKIPTPDEEFVTHSLYN